MNGWLDLVRGKWIQTNTRSFVLLSVTHRVNTGGYVHCYVILDSVFFYIFVVWYPFGP